MSSPKQFSSSIHNQVPGYQRFRRTSFYLRDKVLSAGPMDSFLRTLYLPEKGDPSQILEELIALEREIPKSFLTIIDADIKRIQELVAEDLEEFKTALKKDDLKPRFATERLMATVYRTLKLPPACKSEKDAVSYLLVYCRETRRRCSITYSGLKSIFIEPDGSVSTKLYPPLLEYSEYHIIPCVSGQMEGRSFIS